MELVNTILANVWRMLPLILLFVSGYQIYRMLALHRVTNHIALWFVTQSGGKAPVLFFYLLVGTTVLSFFISNTIAVLTLLPILKTIRDDFTLLGYDKTRITTYFTLSLMYGANIGGMGSLIGGPAHLILLGSLEVMNVPGRGDISFGSWFLWSLPMTILFIVVAWLLIVLFVQPKSILSAKISLKKIIELSSVDKTQRLVLLLFVAFIVFWSAHAIFFQTLYINPVAERMSAAIFFIGFTYMIMIHRSRRNGVKPLLPFNRLFSDLPSRLFLFVGIFILIIIVVRFFEFDTAAAEFLTGFIPVNTNKYVVFFLFTLLIMLLTEVLSNTVVATAFMSIAFSLSSVIGLSPLTLMVGVSCACTCTFMTPIATTSNALAFAEMDGISFGRMALIGFFMNILGALIISLYVPFGISLVYQ